MLLFAICGLTSTSSSYSSAWTRRQESSHRCSRIFSAYFGPMPLIRISSSASRRPTPSKVRLARSSATSRAVVLGIAWKACRIFCSTSSARLERSSAMRSRRVPSGFFGAGCFAGFMAALSSLILISVRAMSTGVVLATDLTNLLLLLIISIVPPLRFLAQKRKQCSFNTLEVPKQHCCGGMRQGRLGKRPLLLFLAQDDQLFPLKRSKQDPQTFVLHTSYASQMRRCFAWLLPWCTD